MKKLFLFILTLLGMILILNSCSAQSSHEKNAGDIANKIYNEIKAQQLEGKNIVVGRIKSTDNAVLEFIYRDELINKLTQLGLNIIDRRQFREIIEEKKFQYVSLVSENKNIQLESGDILLNGDINKINNKYYLSVQVSDYFSGKTLIKQSSEIEIKNINELSDYVYQKASPVEISFTYEPENVFLHFYGQNSYFTKEYVIYKSLDNKNWEETNRVSCDYLNDFYTIEDKISITGLNYYYKIGSVNYANKESVISQIINIFAYSKPEKVNGLSTIYDEKNNSVFITWNKNNQIDFSEYILEINNKIYTLKDNFLSVELPESSKEYTVTAFSKNTNELESEKTSVSFYTVPKTPEIVQIKENHGNIYVKIKKDNYVEKYEIYRDGKKLKESLADEFSDNVPLTGINYNYEIYALKGSLKSQVSSINVKTNSVPEKPLVNYFKVDNLYILTFTKSTIIDFKTFVLEDENKTKINIKDNSFSLTVEEDHIKKYYVYSLNNIDEKSEITELELYGTPLKPQINLYQKDEKIFVEIKDISKNIKSDNFIVETSKDESFDAAEGVYEIKNKVYGEELTVSVYGMKNNDKTKKVNEKIIPYSIPVIDDNSIKITTTAGINIIEWIKVNISDFDTYVLSVESNGKEEIIYSGKENTYVDTKKYSGEITYLLKWKNTKGLFSNTIKFKTGGEG